MTPYVRMTSDWERWFEKKIEDLKVERSIARHNSGKHLRSSGQTVTTSEINDEIKTMEHLMSHVHRAEFCDVT